MTSHFPLLTFFTGVKDVDCIILLNIKDNVTLNSICRSNKYANELCNDYFWAKRFEQTYGFVLPKQYGSPKLLYQKLSRMGISELLKYGSKEGVLGLVVYSLDNGVTKTEINKALIWASGKGHLDVVKYLVELDGTAPNCGGADVHSNDDKALRLASKNGYLDVVKYLIERGADVQADDDDSLQWASANGHLEVVKYLIDNDADIHAEDDLALELASENGHLDVIKYLIEFEPNGARKPVGDSSPTPSDIQRLKFEANAYDHALGWASTNGNLDVVKYLIDNGANIHADNDEALRLASYYGHLDVVKYLIELVPNSADIHANDDYALRWASANGHLDIVKYLIEHCEYDISFLHIIIQNNMDNNVMEYIKSYIKSFNNKE